MSTTISPDMGLTIPGVLSEPGPDYAAEINTDLLIIDAHDHSSGSGVQIRTDGINIDEDFSINNNHIQNIIGARFHNNGSNLSGGDDVNEIYVFGNNLWFNNAAGTPVQITNASEIVSGTASFIVQLIPNDFTVDASANYNYFEVDTTGGSRTLTLPAVSTVAKGRSYWLKDVGNDAANHNITLIRNGTDTFDNVASNRVFDTNGGAWVIVSNNVSNWDVFYFSNKLFADGTFGTLLQNVVLQGSTVSINAASTNQISIGSGSNVITIGGAATNIGSPTLDITSSSIQIGTSATNITIGADATGLLTVAAPVLITANTEISGANLTVTNSGTSKLFNDVVLGTSSTNTLTVEATSTVNSPVTISGSGSLTVASGASLTASLGSTASLLGTVTLGTSGVNVLNVNSNAQFVNGVVFESSGSISLGNIISPSGIGRKLDRILFGTADGNVTYSVTVWDILVVMAGNLGADRTYTLGSSGALSGDKMKLVIQTNATVSFTLAVHDQVSGAQIYTSGAATAAQQSVSFIFNGTHWAWAGL